MALMRSSGGVVSPVLQQAPAAASPPAVGAAAPPPPEGAAAGAAGVAAGAAWSSAWEQPAQAPAQTNPATNSLLMILRTASFPYPSCLALTFSRCLNRASSRQARAKFLVGIVLIGSGLVMENNHRKSSGKTPVRHHPLGAGGETQI